jgi:hypothetical protein
MFVGLAVFLKLFVKDEATRWTIVIVAAIGLAYAGLSLGASKDHV